MWFQGFCEIGGAHCASSSRNIEILRPCLHLGSITLPLDGNSPVVAEGIRISARAGSPCWNAMALAHKLVRLGFVECVFAGPAGRHSMFNSCGYDALSFFQVH